MEPRNNSPNCSWLRFQTDEEAKILYVDILVGRFIDLQPSVEDTDKFCRELYPVLDKIQDLCLTRGFKQVCSADLKDVNLKKIKPMTTLHIIWNVYEYTKKCILLQKCQLSGGGEFFNALVEGVRGFLPPFMRNLITLIPE